jgi:hypothetical protein
MRRVDAEINGSKRDSSTIAASATPAPSLSLVPPCLPAHQTELSSASVAPAQSMRVPSLLTGAYAPPNRAAWAM